MTMLLNSNYIAFIGPFNVTNFHPHPLPTRCSQRRISLHPLIASRQPHFLRDSDTRSASNWCSTVGGTI